ncbi:transporter substrate-binding domain-containing protein [Aestuariirhabdus sp. Z084]|uniref:substrate-binding periplasmic protein n=1 Tax=Aestuariirhabdus haliotis TaxID=2918751 RepID=UPI00201B3DC2|nr:transporter substrate-binding domain-containing protein [Aestuariirhabdus haliotis]MCL6416799.1 transporter substrate-binding domain-containing protein [Aestuariirhabdus haliotis]MCL6420799.1 transporter substrate-binding domain-containing protein [Aestuariirhabdus haliotis]
MLAAEQFNRQLSIDPEWLAPCYYQGEGRDDGSSMGFKRIVRCCLLMAIFCLCGAVKAMPLTTVAQDSRPKYMQDNQGDMQGVAVDILRALEQQDPELKIEGYDRLVPLTRIKRMLKEGFIDLFAGLAYTPERERDFRYLKPPLYRLRYIAVVRADFPLDKDRLATIEELASQGRMISLFGTAASDYLLRRGISVDDGAKNVEAMLLKLLAKRGDILFYHDLGLLHTIDELELNDQVQVVSMSYRSYDHYLVVSEQLEQPYLDRLQRALQAIHDNGVLEAIGQRYHLKPDP